MIKKLFTSRFLLLALLAAFTITSMDACRSKHGNSTVRKLNKLG
jgi:hypothetical protein